jgi:hypothetical protein
MQACTINSSFILSHFTKWQSSIHYIVSVVQNVQCAHQCKLAAHPKTLCAPQNLLLLLPCAPLPPHFTPITLHTLPSYTSISLSSPSKFLELPTEVTLSTGRAWPAWPEGRPDRSPKGWGTVPDRLVSKHEFSEPVHRGGLTHRLL